MTSSPTGETDDAENRVRPPTPQGRCRTGRNVAGNMSGTAPRESRALVLMPAALTLTEPHRLPEPEQHSAPRDVDVAIRIKCHCFTMELVRHIILVAST